MGGDGGVTMESTKQLLAIVINDQYWLYLGNESNMVANIFDTEFACDETLYTYVDNVMI